MATDSHSSSDHHESTYDRLAELLIASKEGATFTPADHRELNELLRNSEANREFAAQFLLDSESLNELLSAREISALSTGHAERPASPVAPTIWPQWSRPILACAAALTLGAFLLITLMNREPIGIVSDQANAEFIAGSAPVDGIITSDAYALTSGMIAIQFRNGVSMTLQAPAEFEVVDEFRVKLTRGYVHAIAPESGYGFVIETPDADIVDLGTEFGVGVDESTGNSEVHVFDGRVDINSRVEKTAMASLEFGESAHIADGKINPSGSARLQRFISPADVGFHRWDRASKSIKQDPDLVFYFGFDPTLGDGHTLIDEATHGQAVTTRIEGARWVTGRWPGKRALLFDQDSDAVQIDLPEALEQFTFSAWVNIDRLDEAKASIFSSLGWEQGDLHLHINRSSHALAAGIYQTRKKRRTGARATRGQWILLTTVFDRATQTSTTWINGEPSMEFHYEDFARVDAGTFLLGNYRAEVEGAASRQFRGRMDEVILWRRTLEAEEIKQLYRQGRPRL